MSASFPSWVSPTSVLQPFWYHSVLLTLSSFTRPRPPLEMAAGCCPIWDDLPGDVLTGVEAQATCKVSAPKADRQLVLDEELGSEKLTWAYLQPETPA